MDHHTAGHYCDAEVMYDLFFLLCNVYFAEPHPPTIINQILLELSPLVKMNFPIRLNKLAPGQPDWIDHICEYKFLGFALDFELDFGFGVF